MTIVDRARARRQSPNARVVEAVDADGVYRLLAERLARPAVRRSGKAGWCATGFLSLVWSAHPSLEEHHDHRDAHLSPETRLDPGSREALCRGGSRNVSGFRRWAPSSTPKSARSTGSIHCLALRGSRAPRQGRAEKIPGWPPKNPGIHPRRWKARSSSRRRSPPKMEPRKLGGLYEIRTTRCCPAPLRRSSRMGRAIEGRQKYSPLAFCGHTELRPTHHGSMSGPIRMPPNASASATRPARQAPGRGDARPVRPAGEHVRRAGRISPRCAKAVLRRAPTPTLPRDSRVRAREGRDPRH